MQSKSYSRLSGWITSVCIIYFLYLSVKQMCIKRQCEPAALLVCQMRQPACMSQLSLCYAQVWSHTKYGFGEHGDLLSHSCNHFQHWISFTLPPSPPPPRPPSLSLTVTHTHTHSLSLNVELFSLCTVTGHKNSKIKLVRFNLLNVNHMKQSEYDSSDQQVPTVHLILSKLIENLCDNWCRSLCFLAY